MNGPLGISQQALSAGPNNAEAAMVMAVVALFLQVLCLIQFFRKFEENDALPYGISCLVLWPVVVILAQIAKT